MKKKILALLLCGVMGASLLAGCGSSDSSSDSDTTEEEEEEAAEEETEEAEEETEEAAEETEEAAEETEEAAAEQIAISVSNGSEDSMVLNTGLVGTLAGISVCRHIYEGLYKVDADGNLVLGQAESVEVSDDGLTYTFTLRDDITWSDGEPVTADDFIYGWEYLEESAGDYSSILDMIDTAEATDDTTIVITLAYPCSYLDSVLAFPSSYPVRADYVEEYGDSYATDPEKAVYNGSYELTSWTHQQDLVLTARADYYDADSITVSEITWDLMTDSSSMMASFLSGDIIYSDGYPSESVSTLEGNGLQYASGYNTYCVLFNVTEDSPEALQDVRVREALSLAIDRERLMSIRDLGDELATTYTPSGLTNEEGVEFNSTVEPWYDSSDYEANCELAKELLAEAGYADGEGFPSLTYIVNNDDRKEIAEAIVGDWADVLGITTVTVENVDGFFTQRQNHDFDLAYFGWYMDYPDVSNMLYTFTSGTSDSGYASEEYDAAYSAATSASDTDTQWEYYAECEAILAEDLPVIPLFHSMNTYLFDDTNYSGLVYYCGTSYFGFVTEN